MASKKKNTDNEKEEVTTPEAEAEIEAPEAEAEARNSFMPDGSGLMQSFIDYCNS